MLSLLKYKGFDFHLMGIGGIGMSAIARLLLDNGIRVSGSDIRQSDITDSLVKLGAIINFSHSEKNIKDCPIVIYSASIKEDNLEFIAAKKKGLRLIPRSDFLGLIFSSYHSIAVTGTHGKTTTSSIIAKIMYDVGFDPLIMLGANSVHLSNSNVYYGKSNWGIFEACEAYGSLYSYNPSYSIITNIELEHLDYFNSIEHIKREFFDFINKIPFYGHIFVNGDDKNIKEIIKKYPSELITKFGFGKDNDVIAENINYNTDSTTFKVKYNDKDIVFVSPLFGSHNVYNILAAIALSFFLKIDFRQIQESISTFKNADKRLQLVDKNNNVKIYSDYAHHPSEIKATISAIKQKEKGKNIIAVFQPHLYSRTKQFYKEFAVSLKDSNILLLSPIYPAREMPIEGVTSRIIKSYMNNKLSYNNAQDFNDNEKLIDFIISYLSASTEENILLCLGAGDIHDIIPDIKERYNSIKP